MAHGKKPPVPAPKKRAGHKRQTPKRSTPQASAPKKTLAARTSRPSSSHDETLKRPARQQARPQRTNRTRTPASTTGGTTRSKNRARESARQTGQSTTQRALSPTRTPQSQRDVSDVQSRAGEHTPQRKTSSSTSQSSLSKGKKTTRASAGAGGVSPHAGRHGSQLKASRPSSANGKKKALAAAGAGLGVGAPVAGTVLSTMALQKWLKSMFLNATALAMNAAQALGQLGSLTAQAIGKAVVSPFMALGKAVGKGVGAVLGVTVGAMFAPVTAMFAGIATALAIFALIGTLFAGILSPFRTMADGLNDASKLCRSTEMSEGGGGEGSFTGQGVPEQAIPWVNNAASHSQRGIPAAFFAYIMDRETDFRPSLFAMDKNGGTWGLFQINAYEWNQATGGNFDNPDIRDPMVHTTYGTEYFDKRLDTVRKMRKNNPTARYATDLTELEALMIAHNAGEGNLQKYPNLPSITQGYLEEFREKFERYGGGEPNPPSESDSADTYEPPSSSDGGMTRTGRFLSSLTGCEEEGAGNNGLHSGGVTEEQAQEIVKQYNDGDGDRVLNEAFANGGGPAKCGSSYVRNCVSFSYYFLHKYTNWDKPYLPGNGKKVASNIAQGLGRETTKTPTAYSIFSHPNSSSAGHTGVVLAVDGDRILIGEAAYCGFEGRVRWVEASEWKGGSWDFADISDIIADKGNDVALPDAPKADGKSSSKVVEEARKHIGLPYVWGGGNQDGPSSSNLRASDAGEVGFDCSGLTTYAFFHGQGIVLQRHSSQQPSKGREVSQAEAQPGDLVHWPGHVAIYAGDGRIVHASASRNQVVETNLFGNPKFYRMG